MYQLPLTLETPAANLALDEALLESAAAGELPGDVLRIWEPRDYFVVLGRSSALAEVHLDACDADSIAVLRRPSGGATVVAGPGCLMYAVVLDLQRRPELKNVDRAHRAVLGRMAEALAPLAPGVGLHGTSDLTLAPLRTGDPPRKFSGNSLRLKRNALLYHGTILYDFPTERLGRWLNRPARRPEYRGERDHQAFVTNFPAARPVLTTALLTAWNAQATLPAWPQAETNRLAATRYATVQW